MQLIKLVLLTFCGALLSASSTDAYEKVEVLKDSGILQKTLGVRDMIQGGGRAALAALGSRAEGRMEITPREDFTHDHQYLEGRVVETSLPVQTSLKPGFKAALGVGISALGLATGGVGSGIVGTLATTALTSSASAFINHGLEATMNHQSINLRKILKDTGKSVAVAALTMGATEALPADLAKNGAVKVAVSSAAHHGVYRQNLIQTIAGQSISEAAALGAGHIGAAYQANDLDWASHKLVHGALAMASTLAYGSLNQDMDWGRALVAAGAVMGAETAGDSWSEVLKDQNLRPQDGESKDDYIQRTEAYAQDWGRNSAACIRVLTASSLVLAGQGESTILAADLSTDTALEHNYWKMCTAIVGDVVQGYVNIKEAWDEGSYWSAAAHVALTGASVGLDAVTQGFGTQGVKLAYQGAKAGLQVGRRILRGSGKKPGQVLKNEGKAPGEGAKTRTQIKRAQEEKDRHTREPVRDKHAPDPENPGRTNLEKADHERMRLRGQTKTDKVHPEFEAKVEKAMKNKEYFHKKELPDGRKRFYKELTPAGDKDPNAFTNGGSNPVKELNPRTGRERNWQESYQKPSAQRPKEPRGEAPQNDLHTVQVHPKPKNPDGTQRELQHYPCAPGDAQKFKEGKIPSLNTKPNPLDKN